MKKPWVLSYPLSPSEDSDQTGRIPRLIWVFAGRTLILLVLSCRGSNFVFIFWCYGQRKSSDMHFQWTRPIFSRGTAKVTKRYVLSVQSDQRRLWSRSVGSKDQNSPSYGQRRFWSDADKRAGLPERTSFWKSQVSISTRKTYKCPYLNNLIMFLWPL